MQFCQLSEIYVVPWSTGGALHRSEVDEGADRSDRVGGDFDKDLIASQLGEAWYPFAAESPKTFCEAARLASIISWTRAPGVSWR